MEVLDRTISEPLVSAARATGSVYCMPVSATETSVEPHGAVDTALLDAVYGSAYEGTATTTMAQPQWSPGHDTRFCVGELVGAGMVWLRRGTLAQPTPFTISRSAFTTFGFLPVRTDEVIAHDEPAAYRAFKDLVRWLDAEDAQVAEMVGIGRTTPYTWKREGREPRAATSQRIYEHHATLDSLRRKLGGSELRRWLHEGVPTRREALLAGGLQSLEADVHDVLFRRAPGDRIDLAAAPEDTAAVAITAAPGAARPSGRRPRRPAR